MAGSKDRTRKYRERQRRGVIVVRDLEVQEDFPPVLVAGGFLDRETDDPEVLREAIQRMHATLVPARFK
jgi:hypothetical protein